MKQVKIVEESRATLDKVIAEIEGRSQVNCLSFDKLLALAKKAETKLEELGIAKKDRAGAQFYYCPAGPTAKSYFSGQGATDCTLIRRSSAWYVSDIHRTKVYPLTPTRNKLSISKGQRELAIQNLDQQYLVLEQ